MFRLSDPDSVATVRLLAIDLGATSSGAVVRSVGQRAQRSIVAAAVSTSASDHGGRLATRLRRIVGQIVERAVATEPTRWCRDAAFQRGWQIQGERLRIGSCLFEAAAYVGHGQLLHSSVLELDAIHRGKLLRGLVVFNSKRVLKGCYESIISIFECVIGVAPVTVVVAGRFEGYVTVLFVVAIAGERVMQGALLLRRLDLRALILLRLLGHAFLANRLNAVSWILLIVGWWQFEGNRAFGQFQFGTFGGIHIESSAQGFVRGRHDDGRRCLRDGDVGQIDTDRDFGNARRFALRRRGLPRRLLRRMI
mmetsp:Transcript_21542/g.59946  ORF Transcript_21542/g.59946 Transcript_21542/m.59946 type:complete len:308 (-) Transcript_21542:454-1377(-)